MKVVFVSNFMNHHQKPFCDAMVRLGVDFSFVAYTSVPNERKQLGYSQFDLPYIINRTSENNEQINDLILNADVVIFGEKPAQIYEMRCKSRKLTFLFSERLFKKGRCKAFLPPVWLRLYKHYSYKKNLFVLCASAYASGDYRLIGIPKNRTFKWGYFPNRSSKDIDTLLNEKSRKTSIVWAGRLIDWKHPEHALKVADFLNSNSIDYHLDIIGTGELKDKLEREIEERGLSGRVTLTGALSFEDVRKKMEKANIALATSDYQEGWGAVVNEVMSSGCAVVACEDMGSVPFLINNGVNGISYSHGNVKDLCSKVLELATNKPMCEKMGRAAYETISSTWNSDIAAERLIAVFSSLLKTGGFEYQSDGPLSRGFLK